MRIVRKEQVLSAVMLPRAYCFIKNWGLDTWGKKN